MATEERTKEILTELNKSVYEFEEDDSVKWAKISIEEGVEFCSNVSPREIRREPDGLLCVEVEKTQLGEKAADGRQQVEIIPGTEHCIPADMVILALGFDVATQML